ncbi:hypothetical protein F2Q69_00005728 [Brassica cretica]|uniref:Uncharacterized protein n=1 Tax=Brassica cretica TaxID=69181 RepID=A0A8S9PDA3_BRACR|nr:hypothetical protein F2Q69_00005728 [Brassica cretica]
MVATLILVRDERGDLHDQDGHLRNAAVVKEEKLQEGDFEVESLMSFGGSHWCRSTPSHEHRSTKVNQNRSTSSPEHRSTTPTESPTSCNAVRIMTHEELSAKHPHPPSPVYKTFIKREGSKQGHHVATGPRMSRSLRSDQPSHSDRPANEPVATPLGRSLSQTSRSLSSDRPSHSVRRYVATDQAIRSVAT